MVDRVAEAVRVEPLSENSCTDPPRFLTDIEIVQRFILDDVSKRIVITPLINITEQLGPTGIDLHLGTEFKVTDRSADTHFDPLWDSQRMGVFRRRVHTINRISPLSYFVVHPKQFALATTLEYIQLPNDIQGRLDGRSIWARHGIQVHCTASIIHPGSKGIITFELQNMEDIPIKLYPGMRLGQLTFFQLNTLPLQSYGENKSKAKFIGHINPQKGIDCNDYEIMLLRRLREQAS